MSDRDQRLVDAFLEDLGSAPVPPGLAASVSRRVREQRAGRASRFAGWSALAAAAVAIVALAAVAFVVAGPKPSPSVATVPSGSASASPASSASSPASSPGVSPNGTLLPYSTPSPGPTESRAPSTASTFHLTLDPPGQPLLVTDNSATIRSAISVPPAMTMADPVTVIQGASPDQVIVGWTGGGCDQFATVTVDEAATTVTVSTYPAAPCDANGADRAVELTFVAPVAASSIRGQVGPPPRLSVGIPKAVWFSDADHGYVAGWDAGTGVSVLGVTWDGGATWDVSALGWGVVTGLGAVGTADLMEVPVVALACAEQGNGGTPEEGCLAGVYRLGGVTRSGVLALSPLVLATQGKAIAVIGAVPPSGSDTTAFAPVDIRLSSDGGARWTKVASPCDLLNMGTVGLSFDATHHLAIVCEGEGATGSAKKMLQRAVDDPPTRWTTMPPLPEQGTGMQLDLTADGRGLAWGPRSPLLTTADGGASWTAHANVADGDARGVEDASAFVGGGGAALVWDPDRQAMLLLLSSDGTAWREVAVYPG